MRDTLFEVFESFNDSQKVSPSIMQARFNMFDETWGFHRLLTDKQINHFMLTVDKKTVKIDSATVKLTTVCSKECSRLHVLFGRSVMVDVANELADCVYVIPVDQLSSGLTHESARKVISALLLDYPFLIPLALCDLVVINRNKGD